MNNMLFTVNSKDNYVFRTSEKKQLFLIIFYSVQCCVTYDMVLTVPKALFNGQCVSGVQKTEVYNFVKINPVGIS